MTTAMRARPSNSLLWFGTGMTLAYWLLRAFHLQTFPPFIDEMLHVHFGERITQTGPLAYAHEARLFTNWAFVLAGAHLHAPVLVARLAVLLFALLGYAAALGIGRLTAGLPGMVIAGVVLLFSPYHLFHDRLALADTAAGAVVMLVVYLALRLDHRAAWRDALLTGLVIFIATGVKITAWVYAGVPFAAALTLHRAVPWRIRLRWFVLALMVAFVLTGSFVLLLAWRGYNPFFLFFQYNEGTGLTGYMQNLIFNIGEVVETLAAYAGWLVLAGCAAGIIYLIYRRHWYLPLCAIAPWVVILISDRQAARYWYAGVTLLLICGAVALALLLLQQSRWRQRLAVVIVTGALFGQWAAFALPLYTDAEALNLPRKDYHEYMVADASGYGLRAALDTLADREADTLIGMVANCYSLRYLALDRLTVECPQMRPTGEDVATLTQLLAERQEAGVYVLLETSAYAPDTAPGTIIWTYERPGSRANLTLYDLTP